MILYTYPRVSTSYNVSPGQGTASQPGSGPKDTKSVKENLVNPEIMQTLDVFKNFVKQQKNLGCEVSRGPVKPMHKVTEDSEALNKLLTSVSSALQKNRVATNKLKSDTTKCLSLCEMAQRTHDTPPGLQNDNVAPLEFFIQHVSKFERDTQVLRQEIDNTEKHVNSLSYPAILTPQELAIALRRLHDSFVALAGRLQSTHAGVIAQKDRHLRLRKHFLKDPTNIFEVPLRSAKKPLCPVGLPKPGPTPFSSMGGIDNISFMTGQDKHVTFSTGPTTLTGWGASTISNIPSSTLIQSPGQPQTSDNQNFQLGKPPAGNKRGKR